MFSVIQFLMDITAFDPVELAVEPTARDRWSAFAAGMAGWTLDAFDYFLVVFCLTDIGATFHQSDAVMTGALFATLALRPIGAFLFGAMADRYGRRPALILNLLLFSVATLATAAAPSFRVFLLIRGVFGIVMGGQWGIGASLAMEKVPVRLRGVLSGLLQQGYSIGNLLAAVATYFFARSGSWRTHLLARLHPCPARRRALLLLRGGVRRVEAHASTTASSTSARPSTRTRVSSST